MSTLPPMSAGQTPQIASPPASKKLLNSLPRVFSTLLIVAAVTSVISTLAFIGYLIVPALAGAQRAHFVALYATGILGLVVAEVCQVLGVGTLLAQWFSRVNVEKKPKELAVLLVSLIPYVVVVIFLITLVVYLRARRLDRTSERTQQARQELKEQTVDTLIDAGANTTNSAAGSPASSVASSASASHSAARPSVQDAVRRVVGPTTGKSVSEVANGVIAVTMIALVLSMLATVGVVVPAKGFAPLQSGGSTSSGSLAGAKATPPPIPSGTWVFKMSSSVFTCTPNASILCSDDNLTSATFRYSGPVTLRHSANVLAMALNAIPDTWNLSPNGFGAPALPSKLTGTLVGQTIKLAASAKGPSNLAFGQNAVTFAIHFTGIVVAASKLSGKYTYDWYWAGNAQAGELTFTVHTAGTWTATQTTP